MIKWKVTKKSWINWKKEKLHSSHFWNQKLKKSLNRLHYNNILRHLIRKSKILSNLSIFWQYTMEKWLFQSSRHQNLKFMWKCWMDFAWKKYQMPIQQQHYFTLFLRLKKIRNEPDQIFCLIYISNFHKKE